MIEVIPAIMPKNFDDLSEKVSRVRGLVSSVQLDLMDGKFVPEKTWPYFTYDDPDLAALLSEEKGLPEWGDLNYEIDLMSMTPESDAFDWVRAGAKRIIFHVESSEEVPKLIGEIRNEFGAFKDNILSPEIGVAALNDTAFSELEEIVPLADFVQVMGIARIGYQGEPFDIRSLERIRALKKKFPQLIISVDGSVNEETAPQLVEAGATRLVSGSYIFNADNPKEIINNLRTTGKR